MKKEIADRWVQELRSGRYSQTVGNLHISDSSTDRRPVGFCCLGVLCSMAVEDGVIDPPSSTTARYADGIVTYNEYEGLQSLPGPAVLDYATLSSETGEGLTLDDVKDFLTSDQVRAVFHQPNPEDWYVTTLVDMNDNGVPFSTIADIIEKHWEKL